MEIERIKNFRLKPSFIILPDSLFRTIIDLVSFVLIMSISIYIPFIFAFDIDTSIGPALYFELILDTWFIIEVVFNIFTGFYEKGVLVINKKQIFIRYVKTWLFIDLASSIPFSYVSVLTEGKSST